MTTPKPTPKATTMSSPTPDPYAGGFKASSGPTTGVLNIADPAKDIYNGTDAQRKALAILLKNAGYNVPTTGAKSTSVAIANAYIQAAQANAMENTRLGINLNVSQWLKNNAQPAGTVGGPRASTQKTTNVLSPTEATALINKVFQDTLGRDATAAELKKFKSELSKAEKANPTVTKYKTVDGVTTAETTGGIDRDQFLTGLINQDAKLKQEITKLETTDVSVLKREKDKAIYDKKVAQAAGNAEQIAALEKTTAYGKDLANLRNRIQMIATQAGATLEGTELDAIAKEALDSAMDADAYTLQSFIDSKLKFGADTTGAFKGKAGEFVDDLRSVAAANGLDLNKAFGAQLPDWLAAINKGESIDTYKRIIRDVAKATVPESIAKLMDQGIDLMTIYTPYINSYAKTFGVSPTTVKISDIEPLAINTEKGTLLPVYEFDKKKRKLSEWQYTPEAKEEVSNATMKILQDFGFMG